MMLAKERAFDEKSKRKGKEKSFDKEKGQI